MKKKAFLAGVLAGIFMLGANVFAASHNSVSGVSALKNGESTENTYFVIEPIDPVDKDDVIEVYITGGVFNDSLEFGELQGRGESYDALKERLEELMAQGMSESEASETVLTDLWSKTEARYIPWKIVSTFEEEIDVELFPISGKLIREGENEGNRPYYNIPLDVTVNGGGVYEAMIYSQGAVSGGSSCYYAKAYEDGEYSQCVGDVNGDGDVNSTDASQILLYAARLTDLDEAAQAAADVNKDGSINSADAVKILLKAAKLADF